MPLLTLKIDVDTYRGTREGTPNLASMLRRHQADATFLFSLGPDHTGWALRRALRPGFFQKVSRTSVVEHYGVKTLMYGVLLPGPDIGRTCAEQMRAVAADGFECGIHTWDHVYWQDNVRRRDAAWTRRQMDQAFQRFQAIFDSAPTTHGAAGWQMNEHAFRQLDAYGMRYASDGRSELKEDGSLADETAGPYRLRVDGQELNCIQMPTTLPTLDEVLGREINGACVTQSNLAQYLLGLTNQRRDHVFTLHSELEGQKLAPIFEQLLAGWRDQGYDLVSMRQYHEHVHAQPLPVRDYAWGELPGRSGEVIIEPAQ